MSKAFERWKSWRAGKRAFEGADLLEEGSFEALVAEKLGRLAENAELPQSIRGWYEAIDSRPHFVEAILARASKKPQLIERADRLLASSYSLRTGDSTDLAIGHIDLGVSHVYGQLTATESSNRKLQTALQVWMAGQLFSSQQVAEFPSAADLENLRLVAEGLAAAARSTWKMPSFIAPLRKVCTNER